ncbi:P-loop containing nucleoside triphosphate hydrolase protein [Paraphoma chrysanthemicola]|nr:P-loop containing nucleoside triphosphate hydrolase protein [Paraphoma chrysanthemicola]
MVRKSKDAAPAVEDHPGGGYITVTAQQSRYALDAVDAPASKEIMVKDLSISVSNRELLSRTQLHLVEARHYVLVGRNGTGKSTLLKAMGDGLVPGIPWSTRILLLGQTRESEVEGEVEKLSLKDETVLQHVIRSDRVRERFTREAKILSEAIDSSTDPMAPVRAYRQITHDRLALQLKEGHRIAERRSGARGKQARKELIKLEERFEESKKRLEEEEDEIDPTKLSQETQATADMLSHVQASLELMDAAEAEAKARVVLLGLGFKEDRIDKPMTELSGGWRTRCDLACALTQYADVLLLDEPTNFLDLPSIIWLQDYIRNLKGTTVLITTHDRDFGDAVAEELIVLRKQVLETFRGNLSLYERERWKKAKWLTKMKDAQDKQKKHIEKTIAGNIKAAKDKGDDKKLKQAASRKKKLDERMGMQVGLKGGRFKLNRDLAGYHTSNRAEIEVPDFDPPPDLSFPKQPPDLRFPGALVNLEKVSFAYPGRKKAPTLIDIDLTIHPGSRIGLAGLNGSGKTTLVSLIIGSADAGGLMPTSGTITRHARARIGRFSQQSVEEISAIASSNPQLTALKHIMEGGGAEMQEKDARGLLGGLGLHGQTVSDVPLNLLSGGQKVRVALAKLLWPPPQLLILDEVTTHLDSDTIMSLVIALKDYDGALLVVTHDRFFMRYVPRPIPMG